MAYIQVFEYQNNKVRMIDVDGEAWFVLKDVCAVLGISNNRMAADRLDDDEKGVSLIDTLGGKQEMVIVNESGLYHVILRSDKPEAAPFRRWVTNDVLPTIRKTGSYNAPQLTRSQLLATALIAAHEELEEKDKQIETMKPKALLFDEPTSALDPISTLKVEDLMFELKKKYTVVIVTHNMQQAVRISDKTAFFLLGEVMEYGQTLDIFNSPKNKKTEEYVTGRFG